MKLTSSDISNHRSYGKDNFFLIFKSESEGHLDRLKANFMLSRSMRNAALFYSSASPTPLQVYNVPIE